MQYTEIFSTVKNENFIRKILIFLMFLLKTLWVHIRTTSLGDAVLMSTRNLCFESKIRKMACLFIPQFHYVKVGFKGVYFSWTCYPDASRNAQIYANQCIFSMYFSKYKMQNFESLENCISDQIMKNLQILSRYFGGHQRFFDLLQF